MSTPKTTLQAVSTKRLENRFKIRLYWKLTNEGLLIPLLPKYRKRATYVVELTLEYLTYEKDLELKRKHRAYDANYQVHYIEYDTLQTDLVSHCLVDWNLPKILPELGVGVIQRQNQRLLDNSLEEWLSLPPVLRKHIAGTIARHMGY